MSDYFDRVERQIVRNVEAGLPRASRRPNAFGYLAVAAAAMVVIVVAGAFLLARGSSPTTAPAAGQSVTVAFKAAAIDPKAPLGPAINRSLVILSKRLASAFPGSSASWNGQDVVVVAPHAGPGARGRILALAAPGQLAFYDWEANALTPNGKTVASQLQTQDATATAISQGGGSGAPGEPAAGSMNLYDAVRLASKQPPRASAANSPQYWMFGAPGSAACAAAARANGTTPVAGQHCLLNGPEDSREALLSGLPAGVGASDGQILVVPRGTVVLQAIPASFSKPTPIGDPSARFYVLENNVALRGSDITNPQQSADPNTAGPFVTFGFTSQGESEFRHVTAEVAHRGDLVSGLGQTLNQHFAVALDDRLITVPFIGFKQYPDGINGDHGADVAGGFTTQSAKDLATILRYGPLPVSLTATG